MKNTKELPAILTALYCRACTSDPKDNETLLILDYAFRRIIGSNTNLISLACIGHTQDEMQQEIEKLLFEQTNYKDYLEALKR